MRIWLALLVLVVLVGWPVWQGLWEVIFGWQGRVIFGCFWIAVIFRGIRGVFRFVFGPP